MDAYLASPQLRVLLYQYIAVWVGKTVAEVAVLYAARYKMTSARDSELAVKALLIPMVLCYSMFAAANVSVAGVKAVIPKRQADGWDWTEVDKITSLHLWMPLFNCLTRMAWVYGIGREAIHDKTE